MTFYSQHPVNLNFLAATGSRKKAVVVPNLKQAPPRMDSWLQKLRYWMRIKSPREMYFYSVLVGIASGLSAVLFSYGLAFAESILMGDLAGLQFTHPPGEISLHHGGEDVVYRPWLLFFLPIMGGLAVGVIKHFFFFEVSGAGTDDMVRAFHQREGRIRGRSPLFKALGTIFTLSTGGSGGREGPTAFIGAGIGTWLARMVEAGPRARRTLLLAGTAAGLGAIFRAPLGGAIVAMEILYLEDIESDSLVPCIISSVTGYLTFQWVAGPGYLFEVPPLAFGNFKEILLFFILGLVCYSVGFIYVKFFHDVTAFFTKLKIHTVFKPALGGLVIGVIALFFPEAIGSGMGFLQQMFSGHAPLGADAAPLQLAGFFLIMAGLRIVATAFSIGSGGSGGVFAPSLFIGAMLGGCVAAIGQYYLPDWNLKIVPFMIVGMGAFFAGVARAPFAAMIMVSDIIGSYTLIPPLMIVSMIALVLSHRWSIYVEQLKNRFLSPAHFWDMQLDVLNQLKIGESFDQYRRNAIVSRNTLFHEMEGLAVKMHASDFVVSDSAGVYQGMVSLKNVRLTSEMATIRNLVTVGDVTDGSVLAASPQASLGQALKIITENEYDKVAVVDPSTHRILGYIRYHDIFTVYHRHLNQSNTEQVSGQPSESRSE